MFCKREKVLIQNGLGCLNDASGDSLEMASHLVLTLGETVEDSWNTELFNMVNFLGDGLEMAGCLVVT